MVALAYAWLSDGLFRGRRWPFIYLGAVITITFAAVIRNRDLYSNIKGTIVLYWFAGVGVSPHFPLLTFATHADRQEGAGPLILSWLNEICSDDTEKRAIVVAAANDLAYVVQAVVSTRPDSHTHTRNR